MNDRVQLQRRQTTSSNFSNPLLASPQQSKSIDPSSTPTIVPRHDLSRISFRPQAKLKIGQPGDAYEQEADQVAAQAVSTRGRALQREEMPEEEELQLKPIGQLITPLLQREEIPEEEEEEPSQDLTKAGIRSENTRLGKDRQKKIDEFRKWFKSEMDKLRKLNTQEKPRAGEALLAQVEERFREVNANVNKTIRTYAPPELISTVRPLIEMVEREIGCAEKSKESVIEGSLYSDQDWNSRLGIPQYRTQSDNLASPEATCNVTSLSMALERVGYSRRDLLERITAQLKEIHEGKKIDKKTKPDFDDWRITKIESYFHNNIKKNDKSYKNLRGQAPGKLSGEVIKNWSKEYLENAQMEDLLDFFVYLEHVDRTSIVANSEKTINSIQLELYSERVNKYITGLLLDRFAYLEGLYGISIGADYNKSEFYCESIKKYDDWNKLSKKIRDCLEKGGSALFSLYHQGKGKGKNGSHIISIQSVDSDGFIVDDPYGKIRSDYSRKEIGDAYAEKGETKRNKAQKNTVEQGKNWLNDWKVENSQIANEDERRGESYKLYEASIKSAFKYVKLFHRGREQQTSTKTKP
jgi:hypothetical protein